MPNASRAFAGTKRSSIETQARFESVRVPQRFELHALPPALRSIDSSHHGVSLADGRHALKPQQRSVVGVVISYGMLRRAGLARWGYRKGLLFFRGLIGFAGILCFFYALTKLPLAETTVIAYTSPVFTAILAALFLKEMLRAKEIAGLMLSLAGVLFVAQPAFLFGSTAASLDLFAVGMAVLGAGFRTTLVTADVTLATWLRRRDLERMQAAGPLARELARQVALWTPVQTRVFTAAGGDLADDNVAFLHVP